MISTYLTEIMLAVVTAGAIGICKYFHSQAKDYKKLLAARESENVEKTVEEKIAPIVDKIKELEFQIKEAREKENKDIGYIISSWRFRIIQLCEIYLQQGYITKSQYIQLSEMYNLYHELGGNGKVTDYYNHTINLEIRPDPEEN